LQSILRDLVRIDNVFVKNYSSATFRRSNGVNGTPLQGGKCQDKKRRKRDKIYKRICVYEYETRAPPKTAVNQEKLQWRGNKRFSGVGRNPSRLLTKKENFRACEKKDELRRAIIQENPYDFQFYHTPRKPDLLFPRHYDSQVMLLGSSKLMKIRLLRWI